MPKKKTHLLFVYGTLRRHDCRNGTLQREGSRFIERATVKGGLYSLSAFPGFKENGQGTVYGEVYEINDEILHVCDGIEGYSEGRDPEHCLYIRKTVKATLFTGAEVDVYIYEIVRHMSESQLIKSGDWFEHTGQNKRERSKPSRAS